MENIKMHQKLLRYVLSLLIVYSFAVTAIPTVGYSQTVGSAPTDNSYVSALAEIESKVEARRKELGIPGMSLVIVKDGKVLYMKGLGYKDFEKKIPVTTNTQFAIGSATKAFTALSVLMAQDEGKLALDDSPKKYLPYFRMYDPESDKSITLRDLLSHSSGLNRTDLAMVTGKLNRTELIEVAAQAKPTAKFRQAFQYQNLMFTAAGEAVAVVEKKPWEKVIPEKVFKPIGMKNSTMSITQMEKAKDRSYGYNYNFDTKETKRLPYRGIDEVAPAGSINSSAGDMAKWLQFILSGGIANGKRIVSEASFAEWMKPQTKISADGKTAYGLGWFIRDWNGLKVVEHGGNIDGFNALVAMVPEKRLGFVMLTNVTGSPLGSELMPIVWENILGKPVVETKSGDPVAPAKAAGDPKELVGDYLTPDGNGTIVVKEVGGAVTLNIEGQPAYTLTPNVKGEFSLTPLPVDSFSLRPIKDASGAVTAISIAQPQGTFEFKKKIASADAKPLISADELMQKVIDAHGGEENWRKLNTRVIETEVDLENQGVKATSTSYAKAPNMIASSTIMTALNKTIATGWDYFDGTGGGQVYTFAPADTYTGKRLEDIRTSSDFYGLLNWKKNYKNVEVRGTRKIGDEEAYVVRFESEKGTDVTEFYSTKTFLLLRREGVITSSTSQQSIPYWTTFEDYREVDGVKMPFKSVNYSPSNGNIVSTVKSVKHNVPVDDKLFAPKKLD